MIDLLLPADDIVVLFQHIPQLQDVINKAGPVGCKFDGTLSFNRRIWGKMPSNSCSLPEAKPAQHRSSPNDQVCCSRGGTSKR